MKYLVAVTVAMLACLTIAALAAPPPDYVPQLPDPAKAFDYDTYINSGDILMFVTNRGSFAHDNDRIFGHSKGTYYPFMTIENILNGLYTSSPLYEAGLWLGGKVDNEVRIAIAEYNDEYVPGPMVGGSHQPDDPDFRVYQLYSDSLSGNPNWDYNNWPVEQGAPWLSAPWCETVPDMIGDQMTWAVYNDADPAQHINDAGQTAPLGVEVRQTAFAWDTDGALSTTIFMRFEIFNKGGNAIEDFYLSLWADPDLGQASDDLVACDTLRSLGICYNDGPDADYGSAPPAIGFVLLQGPLVYSGNPVDTGKMWGTLQPGYQNLGMTAFSKYRNGADPGNSTETYDFMQGLNRDGSPYINPSTGIATTFMHSGDPVTGTGDLDADSDDRRFMLTTGPVTFGPGDSLELIAAVVIGAGAWPLNSVTALRANVEIAKQTYEIDFGAVPPTPTLVAAMQPDTLYMFWTNSIDPVPASVTIGWSDIAEAGGDINPATLQVADVPSHDSVVVMSGVPCLVGDAIRVYFPVKDFVLAQGLLFDYAYVPFTITGEFTDGSPLEISSTVIIGGHISGDVTGDGSVDIADLIYIVEYMFQQGPPPRIMRQADVDATGGPVDIGDVIYLVDFMFQGGPPPHCQ